MTQRTDTKQPRPVKMSINNHLVISVPYAALIKTGIAIISLGNIFVLNGCKKQEGHPPSDLTVRPNSLGSGYKEIRWGASPDGVTKALGMKPSHNFGTIFQRELSFKTESEWLYCTFCKEQLCSVEQRLKVPRSDSPRTEIEEDVLKYLIKQYGRVEPTKREPSDLGATLYTWNDGETKIQYDMANVVYRTGYKRGVGPEVCYKSLYVWKLYLRQWRNIPDLEDFNGCTKREIPFLTIIPVSSITVRSNSLGNGYEGIRWGSSPEEVIKLLGVESHPGFKNNGGDWAFSTFKTESKIIDFGFSRGHLYAVEVTLKVAPSDSPRQEIADGVLKDLIKQYGMVAPGRRESRYTWDDGQTQIEYDTDNETYRTGYKYGTGPKVRFRCLWWGPPPSTAQ